MNLPVIKVTVKKLYEIIRILHTADLTYNYKYHELHAHTIGSKGLTINNSSVSRNGGKFMGVKERVGKTSGARRDEEKIEKDIINEKISSLTYHIESAAEEFLTTNQGTRINDNQNSLKAVSYTHLTLPTIYSV